MTNWVNNPPLVIAMPERLDLTRNAQFYSPKKEINDEIIKNILDAAIVNKTTNAENIIDLFRQERAVRLEVQSFRHVNHPARCESYLPTRTCDGSCGGSP